MIEMNSFDFPNLPEIIRRFLIHELSLIIQGTEIKSCKMHTLLSSICFIKSSYLKKNLNFFVFVCH
jgi:hypothetical protein